MATQKRASRSTGKKTAKSTSARRRAGLKAAPGRRKRATAAAPSATASRSKARKGGGVLKRAIRKGISELAKVGT